jgi:hypothetical protein
MKDGELKTVARYTDEISARIAAGMLIENGIPAAVFGQNSSYVFLNYANPLEVKVAAEDYEDALSLLAAADKAE